MEEEYVKKSQILRDKGYNCAQSVACAFSDVVHVDEATLKAMIAGFGGGMGGNDGTCGALSGAIVVLSLLKSTLGQTKEEIYSSVKELFDTFVEHNGSSVCKELKGTETGVELTSCGDCIIDAVRFTSQVLIHSSDKISPSIV